jgi:hypothetical protein
MDKIRLLNMAGGILLIILSLTVSIPLAIKTYLDGGGPWGFGMVGLSILIPLGFYIFFGITALISVDHYQRKAFIVTQLMILGIGVLTLFFFPVYPVFFVGIPLLFAVAGLISRSKYKYYLLLMIVLATLANGLLLKWELDFDRSIPIIQLFGADEIPAP